MLEYKDKKLYGCRNVTRCVSEFADSLINKRTKSLSLYGWIVLAIVSFVLLNMYRNRHDPVPQESRPDMLRFNPRFEELERHVGIHPDPQRAEFEKIDEANRQGRGPPEIPVFNPNLHPEAHKHAGQEEVDKHGLPQPKKFPVPLLQTPRLNCQSNELDLLLLVQTRPEAVGARTAIRKTWGRNDVKKFALGDRNWAAIFVMGETDDRYQAGIAKENSLNGDILQGGFKDTPFEDTRKFMMALTWINENYANCVPKFILKTQENIFHNMHAMIPWLEERFSGSNTREYPTGGRGLYAGKILRKDQPIRDADDPMRIPERDFPGEFYPDMIQGPVYLFSIDTFSAMYDAMTAVVPIPQEDAYVGLLVNHAGFKPQHNDHFMMLRRPGNICHHLKMFFIYDILPHEHLDIFKSMMRARTQPECLQAEVMDTLHGGQDKREQIKIGL